MSRPGGGIRTDIQGLRAVAVLLVLGFHLWPDRLAGGFVGVDVFFVISGFLITAHLVRAPPRGAADVAAFWARRVRRLLPAALLVIAATVIAGVLVLPATRLGPLVADALASTLYVENWRLAASAVDYLGAGAPPSPLQHYWSLGVEEQFYLVWPVLIGILAWRRRGIRLIVGMAGVFVLSFAASILWTWADPSVAYFATPTRLWELAAGGLLAVVGPSLARFGERTRAVAAWAGVAIIGAAALVLTGETPYPGSAALLPVIGTLLVIAADSRSRFSPDGVLRLRPVQLVGDTSYAVYLWHFPLIVFGTVLLGGELSALHKAVVVLVSLALAWATRMLVEQPARRSAWLGRPSRTFALAGIATLVAVALAFAPALRVQSLDAQAASVRAEVLAANEGCVGAAALATPGCAVTSGEATTPAPERALDDFSVAYADGCLAEPPYRDVTTCRYGDPDDPAYRIALVGNSHAAQWLPALLELAPERSLSITTYLAVSCTPTASLLVLGSPAASDGCADWGARVAEEVAGGDYDLVVASSASVFDVQSTAPDASFRAKVDGYLPVLESWASTPVLVIRDTPFPGSDIPDCVASRGIDACRGARGDWVTPDPLAAAAEETGRTDVGVVDLNALFCSSETCYPVIGGVLVYIDYSHFGATFGRTLAPYLAPALDRALER